MRDIKAHTGLRGIAAFSVFLGHAQFDLLWPGAYWFTGIYSFFYWQNPAVDLFFMLSGFILNYVYLKERPGNWRDYFSARLARICPLYYAGVFAFLAMNLAAARSGHGHSPNLVPSVILPNLAMVQEWPLFGVVNSINTPSWSISVEVFLYIVIFPLFVFILARRSLSRPAALTFLILAILGNAAVSRDLPHPLPIQYSGLLRGITGFTAGFMICELIYKTQVRIIPTFAELILGLLALSFLPFSWLHPFLPILFAGIIAATYSPASRLGRFLGAPFLAYLGAVSYSVYIWQAPVIKACSLAFAIRRIGDTDLDWQADAGHKLLYCFGTTVTLAIVAHASYYWFETPIRRLVHRPRPGKLRVEPAPQTAKL
jgi:peptidoglycan/LPS O-acetylase OafA/YrhL